jgi:hypothetical protein
MGKDLEIVEFEGEMSHRATMPREERGILKRLHIKSQNYSFSVGCTAKLKKNLFLETR